MTVARTRPTPEVEGRPARRQVFEGRTVLVTGGSRGIGRATALAFARRGARVVLHYGRRSRHARRAVARFAEEGLARPPLLQADLSSAAEIERLGARLRTEVGPLDFLVANAASGICKPVMELTAADWDYTLAVSTRSLALLARQQLVAPGGCIVAVSSECARHVVQGYTAIAAAKAGLEALVRSLALELGPGGIRVNAISTLIVDTLSLHALEDPHRLIDYATRRCPLGRLTRPEDVARAIVLLCLPEAAWVTGQVLVADGGTGNCLLDSPMPGQPEEEADACRR